MRIGGFKNVNVKGVKSVEMQVLSVVISVINIKEVIVCCKQV